ncbi:trifunctional serine/threonine-protein kinase/ATP-binding protein/sensor histidine kinase [Cupriavidus plantarum]|uniref:trifunctional serine/threonine-protein kinase/ATP-binding protein/sensor histidine kinase n=1 Tax=Cupriavidus plantarum TaxID=942865 RepID=UPI001B1AB2C9|nr:ATP-binding sensor histidine kinase [Cupriavidus plantarum]CAG2145650.1 Serine/threonine-protein kinase PknD [Cupriavidus plantarum]SMR86724.1 Predicted ATPase [Cupriavidus plantarum]
MIDLSSRSFIELYRGTPRLERAVAARATSLLVAGRGDAARGLAADTLQREYALRDRLDERWAIVPRALVAYGDATVLVLNDPGGVPLAFDPARPLHAQLSLAIRLAVSVAAMHAAGIVHCALTPGRFLIDPRQTDGVPRIAGFGAAVHARSRAGTQAEWDDLALRYMAPELSGRMNVHVDARADLYALGGILYEMLAGRPPFDFSDTAAGVHAHATQVPSPPHLVVPDVPASFSRIVMKLLEKAPEQRYASADELLADLRQCEALRRRHGEIPALAFDRQAALRRLRQAEHMFGREHEVAALLRAYRAVADTGHARVAWVSGDAGIGKSTLLQAVAASIGQHHAALIASVKSEEARRGAPYGLLVQALEQLLQYVIGCPDDEYTAWRERIRAAVDPVARTLIALLPALSVVLGPLPDAPDAPDGSPLIERERVQQAIARLLACFATKDRPLVLVLDDLQWADVGTLQVLERLLQHHVHGPLPHGPLPRTPSADTPFAETSLLLIGAFRSREVGTDHMLRAGLLADCGMRIALGPLHERALLAWLASALRRDVHAVTGLGPLAEEVGRKTERNPFFVLQMLRVLADDGLLAYDEEAATWRWSLERIITHHTIGSFGTVVELLTHRLDQMPADARELLRLLSCLGDRASTETIAIAADLELDTTQRAMQLAADAGALQRDGSDWAFAHDRIREAVYASIAPEARGIWHLRIARRLLAHPVAQADVFAMATQVGLARDVVADPGERRAFARLNIDAGLHAKAATAHHSALAFFRTALAFLGEDDDSEDGLTARMVCGEAEFMTGALAAAEARLARLEAVAGDDVFGAGLARLRVALYTTLGRYDMALRVGLAFLNKTGVPLPMQATDEDVKREHAQMRGWLDRHGVHGLRALPIASEPLRHALADIIADMIPPALFTNRRLYDLILLRSVNLAIAHGHCDGSAYVYVCMNMIVGMRDNDFAASRAFGELALHLVDERRRERYRGRVYMSFGLLVVPWIMPARTSRHYIRRAYDITVESGDHTFAVYCARNEASVMLFAGDTLDDVRAAAVRGLAIARDANFQLVIDSLLAQRALLARLQGTATDEEPLPPVPAADGPPTLVDCAYWVHRLQADLLFGDLDAALTARDRAAASSEAARAFVETADLACYGALALLALPSRDDGQEAALQRHVADLERWAHACPDNFLSRHQLVRAELARTRDRAIDASDAYAAAVQHARRQGFTQIEALAAELAGEFHARRGDEVASHAYLRHARGAWQRWGATAKVRALEARHASLAEVEAGGAHANRLRELDVQAVLRISNALASNIVPARLVDTLMQTALESAGAELGVLVLVREGVWHVPARAQVVEGTIVVTQEPVLAASDVLPVSIVQTVARTHERLVIDDMRAPQAHTFTHAQDDYIRRHQPRSVLCVPLMRYAALVGVLYLENNLAAKMFTADKAGVLEVIASQAAFALENARLYEALFEQNAQRTRAEAQLRTALDELERASRLRAMGELVASIVHEVGQPLAAVSTSASAALRWLDHDPPDIVETRQMLSHIGASATRANAVFQNLRAKSRTTAPHFEPIDLGDALHEAITFVARPLETLGVLLSLHIPEPPLTVHGDRIQLQQVAINLLMNGAESMTAVAPHARRLSLTCVREADGIVRMIVEDSGCGIDPGIADRLFEPLFTTKQNGMGMGLAIVNSIVDAHGGTLAFAPREGGGTRAMVSLPRQRPAHLT